MIRGGFARKNPTDEFDFSMKVSNVRLVAITKTPSLRDFIKRQQLQYAGHVARMSNSSWQKMSLFMKSEHGSQRDPVKRYANDFGVEIGQMLKEMQDKKKYSLELKARFGHVLQTSTSKS